MYEKEKDLLTVLKEICAWLEGSVGSYLWLHV